MLSGLVFKAQGLLPVLLVMLMLLQSIAPLGAKPTEKVEDVQKANSQPVYEVQLTAWPSDVDDMVEAMAQPLPGMPLVPVIEEPVVVMPEMDDEYEESYEGLDNVVHVTQAPHQQDDSGSADVLVNYHKTLSNGTAIYKLLLSNGMANYQRIDLKNIKGKLRPVQQGYYTVPLATNPVSYQTVHYRADENGYNVYKTEQSPRNPAYDFYLEMGREEEAN